MTEFDWDTVAPLLVATHTPVPMMVVGLRDNELYTVTLGGDLSTSDRRAHAALDGLVALNQLSCRNVSVLMEVALSAHPNPVEDPGARQALLVIDGDGMRIWKISVDDSGNRTTDDAEAHPDARGDLVNLVREIATEPVDDTFSSVGRSVWTIGWARALSNRGHVLRIGAEA